MSNPSRQSRIESMFVRAATALQQGDAKSAQRDLRKVVKQIPQSTAAWYNLALSCQHLGQHLDAVKAYRKMLGLAPEAIDGWVNLALSYRELGQTRETEKALDAALKADPRHPRALNLAATLAAERGDSARATELFEAAAAQQPDNREFQLNLVRSLLENNEVDRALARVEAILGDTPGDREYRETRARIYLQARDYARAAPEVGALMEEFPEDELVLRLNLSYRQAIHDNFGVVSTGEKLLAEHPEDAGLWNATGAAYFQLDSTVRAKEYFERALRLVPDHPEYENNLGLVYATLGDKDNAEIHYRRSIALNPDHTEAYRNIISMKRFDSLDDPDAAKLVEIYARDDLDDFSRIKASFALGKVYDDCRMYEEAFATYRRGNDLKFRETRIDHDQYLGHMDRIRETFAERPRVTADEALPRNPIFVLGMPRSGTTLVEQIISRHSQVFGCGELPCIERAITRLEKRADPMRVYPDTFHEIDRQTLNLEAGEYLQWVDRLHDIETPYFTDKMPFNFVHVWLIKALFPHSSVVHCRRHPMDVILSNYFQLYGSDVSMVYDLDVLAQYTVRYARLMKHWHSLFGDEIYAVHYEELVGDVENQTRNLIAATGLPWEDACLGQDTSSTTVRTASIWQVRQGIHTRSRERWRNYESQLRPAMDILVAEGILDSDGNPID